MSTLYGISNCDTVRKARKWLVANELEVNFHDVRKDGLDEATLKAWVAELGWEALLNKRGTTFRQLEDADKADIDKAKAIALMLAHPAMIKRPVLAHNDNYYVGFNADNYQQIFTP